MPLKKPSDYFKKDLATVNNSVQELLKRPDFGNFSDAFETFKNNLNKFDIVSEQVKEIQNEIQNLLKKEDLDNAMMCQLFIVEDSIKEIQNKVKSINEKTLTEIRSNVLNLTEVVNEFLEVEVPKYKKTFTEYEIKTDSKIQEVKDIREYAIENLKTSHDIREDVINKVSDLHNEVINNQSCIRVQNKNLQAIREEVKETLNKINLEEIEEKNHKLSEKIKYLEEIFEKFNEKEFLTETLLTEPSSTNNKDPLTPLDQNFVTLDQLQQHYRLFINRIQQQLATLGGGGETQLKYLDDIVGIATNASAYDGMVLSYNHTIGKFEFITGGGNGNVAISITSTPPLNPQPGNLWYDDTLGRTFLYYQDVDGSQWVDASPSGVIPDSTYWAFTNAGIHTLSNVGIGTTNPKAKLEVLGNVVAISATFTGDQDNSSVVNIPALTIPDPTNFGILGVGRTVGFEDTNIIAHFTDDVDSYSQVIVQNHNSGTSASADFIVNNNQEEGVQYYGDFGINGSNYISDPENPFSDPNGVYLYTAGGSLTIGSEDSVPIKFALNFAEVARVVETGVGIGTTSLTAKLDVQGGDIRVGVNTSEGVILTSPNGTKYRLIVDNGGLLSTVFVA